MFGWFEKKEPELILTAEEKAELRRVRRIAELESQIHKNMEIRVASKEKAVALKKELDGLLQA